VGSAYEFVTGSGVTVTARIDLSSQSERSGSLIVAPNTRLGARTLLNAGMRIAKGSWYADLSGTNLTDERYVAGYPGSGQRLVSGRAAAGWADRRPQLLAPSRRASPRRRAPARGAVRPPRLTLRGGGLAQTARIGLI
jgi:hypothetical protein